MEDKNYFLEQTSNEYEQVNSDLTVNNNQLSDTNRALDNTNQRLETLTTLLESQVEIDTSAFVTLGLAGTVVVGKEFRAERAKCSYNLRIGLCRKTEQCV